MARTPQPRSRDEGLAERPDWAADTNPRHGSGCSLLIFRPLERMALTSASAHDGAGDPLLALAERIRPLIRRTDTIELDERTALVIVLHAASREGARAVFERLRELLTTAPSPGYAAFAFIIGYATSTTPPGQECDRANVIRDAWKPRALLSIALPSPFEAPASAARKTKPGASHLRIRKPGVDTIPATLVGSTRRPPLHLVSRDQLATPIDEQLRERARVLGVPFVQLPSRLPACSRGTIAVDLSRELMAVPIGRSRSTLTVAMHNPRDDEAILRLRDATGLAIFPVLAAPEQLARALRQLARG